MSTAPPSLGEDDSDATRAAVAELPVDEAVEEENDLLMDAEAAAAFAMNSLASRIDCRVHDTHGGFCWGHTVGHRQPLMLKTRGAQQSLRNCGSHSRELQIIATLGITSELPIMWR